MAGGSINVDTEGLRKTGTQIKQRADEFLKQVNDANAKIQSTKWDSGAAKRYREDWTKVMKASKELKSAFDSFGKAAADMATNYEGADKAYKGAG